MTTQDQGPDGPADRRRRPPTTLDLTATEVDTGPAKSGETPEGGEAGSAGSDQGIPRAHRPPSGRWLPLIAAGLIGGIVVVMAGAVVWRAGWVGNDARVAELSARLAGLDLHLRDLERASKAATTATAVDELTGRVGKVEAAVASRTPPSDPNLASRLTAAEASTKTANEAVLNLTRRTESLAAGVGKLTERVDAASQAPVGAPREPGAAPDTKAERADLDRLSTRTATIETGLKSAQTEVKSVAAELKSVTEQLTERASSADPAARRAVLAVTLRDAVERGVPFAGALAAVKPLADPNALAPLEPFAATGVPTTAVLARELSAVVPQMQAAIGSRQQDGFMSRLQANAERLVRVRPVDDRPGDEPASVIARAEMKASQGDPAAAAAELGKLPPAARAPADPWIKKVQSRTAAVATVQRLTAGALAGIATTGAAER